MPTTTAPVLDSIEFENFKILRDARLPLSQMTLIVGPNSSGKSTVFEALRLATGNGKAQYDSLLSAGLQAEPSAPKPPVRLQFRWKSPYDATLGTWSMTPGTQLTKSGVDFHSAMPGQATEIGPLGPMLQRYQTYTFDPHVVGQPAKLVPDHTLQPNGGDLVGVLDQLRDRAPERFEEFTDEVGRWFPEYDRVLFSTPGAGMRALSVRTRSGHHQIPAQALSQGTLVGLALLTLAYIPDAPPLFGLEEPEARIHPRLLRDVHRALRRLAFPAEYGDNRSPHQIILTTHSPYLLDLFTDEPESVVIAERAPESATFSRLSDHPDLGELTRDVHLGDAWYSGVLGGVPALK